jgi:hypothetical protein
VTRRFAEDTRVPVGRTLEEVKAQLRRAGADNIAVFEGVAKSAVGFTAEGRMYRIDVPVRANVPNPEQEQRRAWRLMLLLIKAKLEAVREGATTIEREFFADMLMPNGQTLHQAATPELAIAYDKGVMPERLLLGGPGS